MSQFDVIESVQSAGEQALDAVVGGGQRALQVVRLPRLNSRAAQRRRAQVVKQANQAAERVLNLPEQALVQSLQRVKGQATRKDVVGVAARTLLEAVNTPAGTAAGFFSRIEKATALPKRAPRATVATAARKTTRTRRAVAKPAARGRKTAARR
jgi:hypothetical protein